MARLSKKRVLWSVLHPSGAMVALHASNTDTDILPLFSSPMSGQVWIMQMGLNEHVLTAPLWPLVLRQMLEAALDFGFENYALDPPASTAFPIEIAVIEDLLDQVEVA